MTNVRLGAILGLVLLVAGCAGGGNDVTVPSGVIEQRPL